MGKIHPSSGKTVVCVGGDAETTDLSIPLFHKYTLEALCAPGMARVYQLLFWLLQQNTQQRWPKVEGFILATEFGDAVHHGGKVMKEVEASGHVASRVRKKAAINVCTQLASSYLHLQG